MDDIVRGNGSKLETRWAESPKVDDYRDWLVQIHREAMEHTENIVARQGLPNWVKA